MRGKWVLVLALVFLGIMAQPAAARDQLDLTVTMPLKGAVKYNGWTRIEVTVANHGLPFAGFLELGTDKFRSSSRQSTIRQELQMKQSETKQLVFDLPSEMLMRELELRVLEAGKVVQTQLIPASALRDERIVGVVHESDSAFHFMNLNGDKIGQGVPYMVKNLQPDSLPTESWIYQNLDILALGGQQAGRLSDAQIAAIKEWIRRGGVVVLAAGPHQDAAVDRFRDLLPVKRGESGLLNDLSELRSYTGDLEIPFSSIPVYDRNAPLFVSKPIGAGILLFANFDVTKEPMASWQHNRQLWQNVLERHGAIRLLEQKGGGDAFNRSLLLLSKYIPGVQTPSVGLIIAIWAFYLVLAAPVLYLVLKRLGRREWAWGIIPAAAVLLSAGVFLIGRPLVVKEDSSFAVSSIRIVDEKLAEVQSATTFVTVAGGDYQVETEEGFLSLPLSGNHGDFQPMGVIRKEGSGNTLVFQHVPYLSGRQAAAYGVRSDIGQFRTELTVIGNQLQGRIKNDTTFDLEHVYLEMGMQRYSVGALKKGEEKRVDTAIEPVYLPGGDDSGFSRKETLEEQVERIKNSLLESDGSEQIRLVGVSSKPLPIIRLQTEHQAHYWNVITQAVSLRPDENGKITYPYGLLGVDVYQGSGDFERKSRNLGELGKGTVTFALKVGHLSGTIDRVTVPLDLAPFRPFHKEIYHARSGQWKNLERDQRIELRENVREYINRDGVILIRFTNPGHQRISLPMPFFQVEGEEKRA
jgi:hypothetical protein